MYSNSFLFFFFFFSSNNILYTVRAGKSQAKQKKGGSALHRDIEIDIKRINHKKRFN